MATPNRSFHARHEQIVQRTDLVAIKHLKQRDDDEESECYEIITRRDRFRLDPLLPNSARLAEELRAKLQALAGESRGIGR